METQLMFTSQRLPRVASGRLSLFAFMLLIFTSAVVVRADVRDEGHFFSDDAVRQANDTIAQIRRDYGRDVVIETYPTAPDAIRQRLGSGREGDVWNNWMLQRISDAKVHGIFVVITKDPPHIQSGVDNDTGKQAFIKSDHEQLTSIVAGEFRSRQFDDGLRRGLEFVQKTLARSIGNRAGASAGAGAAGETARARDPGGAMPPAGRSTDAGTAGRETQTASPPPPQPQSSNERTTNVPPATASRGFGMGTWMCMIIGAVIVIALLRRVFAARTQAAPMQGGYGPAGGYGPGPGYPTGGGAGRGFLGGLLGGLLGGAAYDRWTRGSSDASTIYNDPARHDASMPMPAGSDPTQDASQDFASSSGADFGSTDTSGSSGADFGGGGDVGGGGGGDSGSSSGADF